MIDIKHLKNKLEEEKLKIESELLTMSTKNPRNPEDWQAVPPKDTDEREPDLNEAADNVEDYEEAFALNNVLEKRLNEVKTAINKINENKYGICSVGGREHEIEEARLEANPAAATCIEHMEA